MIKRPVFGVHELQRTSCTISALKKNKFNVIDSDRQAMIEGIKTTGELINIALSSAQTSSTVPDSCAFHSEISKQNLVIHKLKEPSQLEASHNWLIMVTIVVNSG